MERRVLVTGGNSGIGLATALDLARRGFRVTASVRAPDKAKVVEAAADEAGVAVETVVLDLDDPASYEDLVPDLDLWGLVNNAGWTNAGTIEDVPVATARRQFDALVFGPLHLATLALPAMRRRGEGRIVTVSSVAGHVTGPLLGWYCAAKHAVSAAIEALRAEVKVWGVDVVAVEPGAIRTPIWDKAAAELERRRPTSRTPQAYDRGLRIVRRIRPRMPGPEAVAAVIGEALQAGRPRRTYKVGWDSYVLPPATRVTPPGVRDQVVRRALRL